MAQLETYRTFVALPLSADVERRLADLQRTLRRSCPEGVVRWVPPQNIHLTLFFVGDTLLERLAPIKAGLTAVARNVRPFSFAVQGLGAFPNLHRPRVVWVGLEEQTGALELLHQAVNEAMASIGFAPETRRFSPHLTLGRIRRRASRDDARRVGQVVAQTKVQPLGKVRVEHVIFFRSILRPSGAEYSALARFDFGAG